MSDDLPLATVLISEALLRAGAAGQVTHEELKRSLREVLDENGTTIRLEPYPLLEVSEPPAAVASGEPA